MMTQITQPCIFVIVYTFDTKHMDCTSGGEAGTQNIGGSAEGRDAGKGVEVDFVSRVVRAVSEG